MSRMSGLVRKFVLIFTGFAFLIALPNQGRAQNCNPPSVFATPTLDSPGGCPLVTSYLFTQQANAQMVAIADVNGDGKPDLVIAESGNSWDLAVELGNGDGTFQAPIHTYPGTCCSPDLREANWVAVGDFNGDGKPDVAIGSGTGNAGYVTILLGNGDGTFTLSQIISVAAGAGPVSGAVGDFNGDGKLDLAFVNNSVTPGVVDVYLGNGNGTFSQSPVSAVPINASGSEPNSIVVGDFNKDGKLDFAASSTGNSSPNTVSVAVGNGDGTFQTPVNYTLDSQNVSTGNVISIISADFNGDGYPDIATLSNRGLVEVLLNNGHGTFPATPAYYFVGEDYNNGGGQYPQQLAVADFNKDGHPDLVAIDNQQDSAAVMLNNGDGTFAPPSYWVWADRSAASVAVGDLNADGNPDFVVSTTQDDSVTIFLGNGDGTFRGVRDYLPIVISQGISTNSPVPATVGFGDFNSDGKMDMAIVDSANNAVTIYLNNGDGTFKESANYSTGASGASVAVGDVNGDGKPDIVVGLNSACGSKVGFGVLLGNGDGTFQPVVVYANSTSGGCAPTLALADVNGDGKLDVIANSSNSGTNASFWVNLGNGDGTFQQGIPMSTPAICTGGDGAGAVYLLVTDVNGDGKPDIIGACDGSQHQSYISALLGKGDGTFGTPTQVEAGTTPVGLAAGDYNKDGKIDLAVVDNYPTPEISILLGNGDGTFQAPVAYSVFSSPFWQNYITEGWTNQYAPEPDAIVAADFNGDGNLDLLVGDNSAWTYFCHSGCGPSISASNGVQLFLGNGDGTFQPEQSFLAGQQTSYFAVADLNGDGAPDVAAVDPNNNFVAILLNQSLASPVANLSGQSLSFGSQAVGTTSAAQSITLSNMGGSNLTVYSISVTGANAGDFEETNSCPAALAPKASCAIDVSFAPTIQGARTASVVISDNSSGGQQSIALSGTGTVPVVSLAPTGGLSFGSQAVGTTSSGQNITLTNTGGAALSVSSVTITGANAGDFSQTNTCGSSVTAGALCTIRVTFAPSTAGARSASVLIADNAAGSPQTVSLSGTGVVSAVTLAPTTLTFATQNLNLTSAAQSVKLTNIGMATLTINSISITGTNAGDFAQTNMCGTSLPLGANCAIGVTFTPAASGARSASVSISDNAPDSPQTISLSGTGGSPDFSLSVTSNSATVTPGSTATYQLTVTPVNGFIQAVTFACAGLPSLSSCGESPASVTPSGTATTSMLSISTTATTTTTSSIEGIPRGSATRTALALAAFFGCLFSLAPARRRGSKLFLLVLVAAMLGAFAGCGGGSGGHNNTTTNPGTPTGTYTVTVMATSGSGNSVLSHSTTVTLIVQ